MKRYVVMRITGTHVGFSPGTLEEFKAMFGPGTVAIDGWVYNVKDEPEFQVMAFENGIMTVLIGPLDELEEQ